MVKTRSVMGLILTGLFSFTLMAPYFVFKHNYVYVIEICKKLLNQPFSYRNFIQMYINLHTGS